MGEIRNLQEELHTFCVERDWKQFHNPKDLSISLVLEATELLEQFQWKNAEETTRYIQDHREQIADELADTFYWVLLLSYDLGIDLAEALRVKIKKNDEKYPVEKVKGSSKKYTEY